MCIRKSNPNPINTSMLAGSDYWFQHLQSLVVKYSDLGAGYDLHSLATDEAWSLYCTLRRMEVERG